MNQRFDSTPWDSIADWLDGDVMIPTRYAHCARCLAGAVEPDTPILDVGCGSGQGLALLYDAGFRNLTGVDASPERVQRAQRVLGDRARVTCVPAGDALPFADGTFGAVISAAVIEHVTDHDGFVRELTRVTAPDAEIVISSDCYMWRILEVLGAFRSVQPVDRALFPLSLDRLVGRHGLRIEHCEGFEMPGQGSRFARLLALAVVTRLPASVRRLGRRVAPDADLSGVMGPEDIRMATLPPLQRGRSVWRALPELICADENVFLLRKVRG